MQKIIGEILEAPFKFVLDGIVAPFIFPPKPRTPKEQLIERMRGKDGQIRRLEEELSYLRCVLRDCGYNERALRDQLAKKEAAIKRLSVTIQYLESRLLQTWNRNTR